MTQRRWVNVSFWLIKDRISVYINQLIRMSHICFIYYEPSYTTLNDSSNINFQAWNCVCIYLNWNFCNFVSFCNYFFVQFPNSSKKIKSSSLIFAPLFLTFKIFYSWFKDKGMDKYFYTFSLGMVYIFFAQKFIWYKIYTMYPFF